ncbi:hypothetical protein J3458_004711 [Metarhizium acridum]|uniref:uncharacterized protein n=1 Tax=Metarhizium acridum TaxID=92637 RepID=UPI001C6B6EAD|nr:hypothetical protein J3458_004711 [Metarhizium acridum]
MSCSSELRQRRRSWNDTPGSPHPEFSVLLDPSISCAVLCCRSVATSQGAFSVLPTMAQNMDRGLDEIIAEKRTSSPRNRRGGRDNRRRDRNDYPRDGVRKSTRDDRRNIDSEWVHDRYDESESRRGPASRRRRDSPVSDNKGSKIRVENIHYDLTEEDLDELFARIGRVSRLNLRYDRAGRSEGVAYVTYEQREDAEEAIKQFDGANANGKFLSHAYRPPRALLIGLDKGNQYASRYSLHGIHSILQLCLAVHWRSESQPLVLVAEPAPLPLAADLKRRTLPVRELIDIFQEDVPEALCPDAKVVAEDVVPVLDVKAGTKTMKVVVAVVATQGERKRRKNSMLKWQTTLGAVVMSLPRRMLRLTVQRRPPKLSRLRAMTTST